jgi:hypothetical protein
MPQQVGLSAIVTPELDSRSVDRETAELEAKVQEATQANVDIQESVDVEQDGITGDIADGVGGERGGIGGTIAGAGAARAAGGGGMLGGAISGGILKASLVGAVGVGILSGIQSLANEYAPRLSKELSLIGEGVGLLKGAFGEAIAEYVPGEEFFNSAKGFYTTATNEGLSVALQDAITGPATQPKVTVNASLEPQLEAVLPDDIAKSISTAVSDAAIDNIPLLGEANVPDASGFISELGQNLGQQIGQALIDEISSIDITSQDIIDAIFGNQQESPEFAGKPLSERSVNPEEIRGKEINGVDTTLRGVDGNTAFDTGGNESSNAGGGLIPDFLQPANATVQGSGSLTQSGFDVPQIDLPGIFGGGAEGGRANRQTQNNQTGGTNQEAGGGLGVADEVSSKLDEVVRELQNLDLNVSLNEQDLARSNNSAEKTFDNRRDRDNN